MLAKYIVMLFLALGTWVDAAVLELNDNNFSTEVERNDHTFVMFYTSWCTFCRTMDPEVTKAAGLLVGTRLAVAKVNCGGAGTSTCDKNNVRVYPTMKVFSKGGKVQVYSGAREGKAIANYLKAL